MTTSTTDKQKQKQNETKEKQTNHKLKPILCNQRWTYMASISSLAHLPNFAQPLFFHFSQVLHNLHNLGSGGGGRGAGGGGANEVHYGRFASGEKKDKNPKIY